MCVDTDDHLTKPITKERWYEIGISLKLREDYQVLLGDL